MTNPARPPSSRVATGIIIIVLLVAGALYAYSFETRRTPQSQSISSASPFPGSSVSSNSSTTTSSGTAKTITVGIQESGGVITEYPLHPCNCSVEPLRGAVFPNLQDLVDSSVVLLGNVTSRTTVSVDGVPFTTYNVTNIQTLAHVGIANYSASGQVAEMAWVGGTVNGTTMNAVGYPTLGIGALYILFFGPYSFNPSELTYSYGAPGFGDYWLQFDGGSAASTTGGPQGLFYVQDGKVYSLDNLYPQDDSWLPVKAEGVPLSEFVAEVQSASASATTASSASSSTLPGCGQSQQSPRYGWNFTLSPGETLNLCLELYYYSATGSPATAVDLTSFASLESDIDGYLHSALANFTMTYVTAQGAGTPASVQIGGPSSENEGFMVEYQITPKPGITSGSYGLNLGASEPSSGGGLEMCTTDFGLFLGDGLPNYYNLGSCILENSQSAGMPYPPNTLVATGFGVSYG